MFKKILSWFTKKETPVVEQEETKQQEYKPDISEPVLSFVEVFLKNPKRFRFKTYGIEVYSLTDKETREEFKFSVRYHYEQGLGLVNHLTLRLVVSPVSDNIKNIGLTYDEEEYLVAKITNYFSERKQKILSKRNTTLKQRSRNRLTKIYKGE